MPYIFVFPTVFKCMCQRAARPQPEQIETHGGQAQRPHQWYHFHRKAR